MNIEIPPLLKRLNLIKVFPAYCFIPCGISFIFVQSQPADQHFKLFLRKRSSQQFPIDANGSFIFPISCLLYTSRCV